MAKNTQNIIEQGGAQFDVDFARKLGREAFNERFAGIFRNTKDGGEQHLAEAWAKIEAYGTEPKEPAKQPRKERGNENKEGAD